MSNSQQVSQYWSTKSVSGYLTGFDPVGRNWPFGEDLPSILAALCADETVIDFGCGTGRFAPAFSPAQYVGIDFNQRALSLARSNNPTYTFEDNKHVPDQADTVLAIEVLLHIHDEEISQILGQLASMGSRVLALEVMNPLYRNEFSYNLNRSVEKYEKIAAQNHLTQKVLDTFPIKDTNIHGTLVEWNRQ